VNINKRYFLILLGAVLLIGGGFIVYAATAPNPGHTGSQINVDCPDGSNNVDLETCLGNIYSNQGGEPEEGTFTAVGEYTGSGSARYFDIGFTPKFVSIYGRGTSIYISCTYKQVGQQVVQELVCKQYNSGVEVIPDAVYTQIGPSVPKGFGFQGTTWINDLRINNAGNDYVYFAAG